MQDNGTIEIKDFDYDPTPKRFRIYRGGPVLEAAPELPLPAVSLASKLAREAQQLVGTGDTEEIIGLMRQFLGEIILDESQAHLEVMFTDKQRPVSAPMLMNIFMWLMESYGMRPTQPSSDSSPTSPDDGSISSTGGASLAGWTPGDFPYIDSSTSSTTTSTSAEVSS